jgi:SAM-dependent methyltransferase
VPSYDQFAPHFDAWQRALGGAYDDLILPRLLAILEQHAPHAQRVADLGIGTGDLVLALATRGFEVVGVDCSLPMLEVSRRKMEAAAFARPPLLVQEDIRELRLSPPVDVALCVYTVMNQLTGDTDLERVLHAVDRSLADEGIFVFELNLPVAYDRFWTGDDEVRAGAIRIRRQHRQLPGTTLIEAEIAIETADGHVAHDHVVQRPYADAEVEAALGQCGLTLVERKAFDPFDHGDEPTKALWVVQRLRA